MPKPPPRCPCCPRPSRSPRPPSSRAPVHARCPLVMECFKGSSACPSLLLAALAAPALRCLLVMECFKGSSACPSLLLAALAAPALPTLPALPAWSLGLGARGLGLGASKPEGLQPSNINPSSLLAPTEPTGQETPNKSQKTKKKKRQAHPA